MCVGGGCARVCARVCVCVRVCVCARVRATLTQIKLGPPAHNGTWSTRGPARVYTAPMVVDIV